MSTTTPDAQTARIALIAAEYAAAADIAAQQGMAHVAAMYRRMADRNYAEVARREAVAR